jgi:hypothetical protein
MQIYKFKFEIYFKAASSLSQSYNYTVYKISSLVYIHYIIKLYLYLLSIRSHICLKLKEQL